MKKKETKQQDNNLDRMGRVNNVLIDIINKSGLSLSEILMIIKLIETDIENNFRSQIEKLKDGG